MNRAKVNPRRPLDDRLESGYRESDIDYVKNNLDLAIQLLDEEYARQMEALGVLTHKYVNASDDVAAYRADQCGRQAVTAQFAWDNLCDETLYVYIDRTDGTDPWVTIDGGMDKLDANDCFVLCFGRTGEIIVGPQSRVFASKRTVQKIVGGL